MKSPLLCALLFTLSARFLALEAAANHWSTPDEITTSATFGSGADIYLTYNSSLKAVFATWEKFGFSTPAYSIYKDGAWSTPADISTSANVFDSVTSTYKVDTDQTFAAWTDGVTFYPNFSIYSTSSGWSAAATIEGTPASTANDDVYLAYSSSPHRVFAAWIDTNNNNRPTFSIYTSGSGWSTPSTISTTSAATRGPYLVYDGKANKMMAVWIDTNDQAIYASIHTNGSGWSAKETVASTQTNQQSPPFACYDSQLEKVFLAWQDDNNHPMYSTYSSGAWSTEASISTTSTVFVAGGVFLAYDSYRKQVIASWADGITQAPTYSIYSSGAWSTPAAISNLPAATVLGNNVILVDNSNLTSVFAAWSNNATEPTWSSYRPIGAVPSLSGIQYKNNFGVIYELYNHLTWGASSSDHVSNYKVYRASTLIATLNSSSLSYDDHNRPNGVATTYTVTGIDAEGRESEGSSVTVQP